MKFNEYISKTIVNEKSAEDLLKNYTILKEMHKNVKILNANNREKFIALLKKLGQWVTGMDFSYENFQGMDLSDIKFSNCVFLETNFEKAELDVIEFHSCILDDAMFCSAVMECACFQRCSCRKTDFSTAHLMATYIHESDWSEANISGANLIEVEAHKWKIDGMIVNDKTAIIEGEFYDVNWSKVNVSHLNISLDQVKYFLQSTNGVNYLQVYENYKPSPMQKREDAILRALWEEHEQNVIEESNKYQINSGFQTNKDLTFLSYASEQKDMVRGFYESEKNKYHLWMDIELVIGKELKKQIDNKLRSCKIAIIFLSKEYMIKAWTRYEFRRLLEEKKKRNIKIITLQLTAGLEDVMEQYWSEEAFIVVKDIEEILAVL